MDSDCLNRNKNARFESDRLFYRGIAPEDAAKIVEWRSNERIIRFFLSTVPLTMEKHLSWFEAYLSDPTRFDYMIFEKATGRKIGTVGLQNLSGEAADLSYLIEIPSQGMGFGSEAIRAMSAYAFGHFGLQRLSAVILTGNSASEKAAKRAGYRLFSRVYRLERPPEIPKAGRTQAPAGAAETKNEQDGRDPDGTVRGTGNHGIPQPGGRDTGGIRFAEKCDPEQGRGGGGNENT